MKFKLLEKKRKQLIMMTDLVTQQISLVLNKFKMMKNMSK